MTYTATDNLGASTVLTKDIVVADTDIPTAKFRVSNLSGTFPLTVTFDASESSDSDGIVEYRWVWGSGAEERTSNPIITHTFSSPGVYNVRLRTLDATAEGETFVLVTLGDTPSLRAVPVVKAVPHEVLLGTPIAFDGGDSFTPAVGDAITGYNWSTADFLCPGGDCTLVGETASYTYPLARNYFASLGLTAPGAPTPSRTYLEVFNVNAGRAPKAVIRNSAATGPAPLTVNFDCGESYDYDGVISKYIWSSGEGDRTDPAPAAFTHMYNTPGVYSALCETVDNDENTVFNFVNVSVLPGSRKKLDPPPYDGEREYRRGLLTNACWAPPGDAYACYELGQMYQEDGDDFTKQKLWEKSCGMGYAAACAK